MSDKLNSRVKCGELRAKLKSLIGSSITVYTKTGGNAGAGFSGILIRVNLRSIELAIKAPSFAKFNKNCQCSSCTKRRSSSAGVMVMIMLRSITAVAFNFI